ncbi:MFS transporter [Sphaerochaeta globosa]|uniref:Major facilitator superfamily MFS_1 n=1 Tax=Sphaerochaeta globosa (strain ATCC BAA-1886 / DSM 22777 / Buddy) TaxID=158189 RepID=F0RTS9_SPHGB|nr:MFS transporter [Sphaerochaeta globosa]ADY13844.1 major facilitator superfamily MFS_1 [Sphaerochaeta globosa str. Buddy]
MIILYSSFFFVYSIYAIVNPFLQVMLRNMGYSYEMVGVLLSLYEIAGIVGPLLVARQVDTRGTMKGTVLFSTVLSSFGMLLLMLSSSLWMTIAGLILVAFFLRSLMPVLDTYTNNLFNGDSLKYTLIRSFGTVGFVFFSLLFAATKRPDLTNNVSIGSYALIISSIFFALVLGWKREPKKSKLQVLDGVQESGTWYDRAFVVGIFIIALNRISMSSVSSFFSLYLVEELQINAISLMNALAAGSEFGAMIIAGILIQRKKALPVHLFIASGLAMMARLVIYAMFPSITGVLAAQLLHSIGYGFFHPAAIYFVARRVKRSHRTLGMSIYISLGTGLPAVLGSSLGGLVVESYGYKTLFLSYSVFALASAVLCLVFYRTMKTPPLEEV